MKIFKKRSISVVLAIALCLQVVLPSMVTTTYADEPESYTIENDNISATISTKNGGFTVKTIDGNVFKKDDNNKDLLFHNGEYDTSFTSFEVTRNGETKEYIFGGDYGFLGVSSSSVSTVLGNNQVQSKWTVSGIEFTQILSLADSSSTDHGMVNISYTAKIIDGGSNANIKARVLLDTALGSIDYAYYNIENANIENTTDSIKTEKIIKATDYTDNKLPSTLFATDDIALPSTVSYTVNSVSSEPYQVAFAHWNNLASTIFEFSPDQTMTFTNQNNIEYLSADSAYALYYDMGTVTSAVSDQVFTTYGVYSNKAVAKEDSIAINLVTPKTLELTSDKSEYKKILGAKGDATFSFDTTIENISSIGISSVALAVYTQSGMTALDANGNALSQAPSYDDPYYETFYNLESGKTNSTNFEIKADVGASATYRKIEVVAFDTSVSSSLSQENIIGVNSFYVLCPSGDGELPEVTFTGADPKILYYEGLNHYIVRGNNFNMLKNTSDYELYFENVNDKTDKYTVPDEQIFLNSAEGTLDVITKRDDGKPWREATYQLYIKWADGTTQAQTGNAVYTSEELSVTFSAKEYYKTNTYGILIVYQAKTDSDIPQDQKYYIKELFDEASYKEFVKAGEYKEILLVFRGDFAKNPTSFGGGSLAGLYPNGVYIATALDGDTITINDCLDLEQGTVAVYYNGKEGEDGTEVLVDFDGKLYTSVEKTGVWTGKASLTAIKNGSEFSLLQYDVDGNRKETGNPISLVWPLGASIGQSLAGMIFELGYGELGVIKVDDKEVGRVVSFTASIDLSFVIPNGSKVQGNKVDSAFGRVKDAFNFGENDYSNADLRTRAAVLVTDAELTNEEKAKQAAGDGTLAVTVKDVLFGCGTGFYGLNFAVDIVIPAYTENMPKMGCKLAVNTINNWSFDIDGSIVFSDFSMGVTLEMKSYNDIPIAQKLFIYVKSSPGINVDGTGALWITGGGGGFDNLYDTILRSNELPTMQLMLRLYFEIYKTISGQADTVFSLQGFSNSMTNLTLKGTGVVVMRKATHSINWLPSFSLKTSITLSLLGCIDGGGYIVVEVPYDDPSLTFAEGYAYVKVKIPAQYGIAGGMEIAGVEVGVNTDKIWGVAKAIGFLDIGVIYYWGDDDVYFGKSVEGTSPTYPDLLGYEEPVLLGYDEATGKEVYMKLFTNFSVAAKAQIVSNTDENVVLFDTSPTVTSNLSRTSHSVNLGTYQDKSDVFTLTYDAESLENARQIADQMSFDLAGNAFTPAYYGEVSDSAVTANLTYDNGKANLAIFARDASYYDKLWTIKTPFITDIIVYDVAKVSKVDTVSGSILGDQLTAHWTGNKLGDLDSVAFYLTTDNLQNRTVIDPMNQEMELTDDIILGTVTDKTELEAGTKTFDISPALSSGDYYIKAVYNREGVVCGTAVSSSQVSYANKYQSNETVSIKNVSNGGDYCYNVTLSALNNATGYVVNILNADGSMTDIYDVKYDKTGDEIRVKVGGAFEMPVYEPTLDENGEIVYQSDGKISYKETAKTKTSGLIAGKDYIIEVMPYNDIDENGDGVTDYVVYGAIDKFNAPTLEDPTPTEINITSKNNSKNIVYTTNANTSPIYPTFSENSLVFSAKTSETITGIWSLDTAYEYDTAGEWAEFTNLNSLDINLSNIEDGTHQLKIWGKDQTGDSFSETYVFVVDTTAPSLLVSAPLEGEVYSETDGSVEVVGIIDVDALLTVKVSGVSKIIEQKITDISGATYNQNTGEFSFKVTMDKDISGQNLTIMANDQMGNSSSYSVFLANAGLGNVKEVQIFANGASVLDQNINSFSDFSSNLSLMAVTNLGNKIKIDDANLVNWSLVTVSGDATITPNGLLNVKGKSEGFVQGAYSVSSLAAMTSAISFSEGSDNTGGTGSTGGGTIGGSGASGSTLPTDLVKSANANEIVTIKLPSDYKTTDYMVYYYNNDKKAIPVMFSAITDDGNIVFLAPISAKYYVQSVNAPIFSDVYSGHYAKLAIDFCTIRGLFNGTGNGKFKPESPTTRAMFVTLLWRLSGEPTADGTLFYDVDQNMWYTEAIRWASSKGIVLGYSDTIFGTNDAITREQMCAIIIRYAEIFGHKLGEQSKGINFIDQEEISNYVKTYIDLCSQYGLVIGDETGAFNPSDNSTRGQIAIVLERYISKTLSEWTK